MIRLVPHCCSDAPPDELVALAGTKRDIGSPPKRDTAPMTAGHLPPYASNRNDSTLCGQMMKVEGRISRPHNRI
jgi:hypothetical protein